jgi:hypothetical protein
VEKPELYSNLFELLFVFIRMNKVLLVKHTHKGPYNARTREHTGNTIQQV